MPANIWTHEEAFVYGPWIHTYFWLIFLLSGNMKTKLCLVEN